MEENVEIIKTTQLLFIAPTMDNAIQTIKIKKRNNGENIKAY